MLFSMNLNSLLLLLLSLLLLLLFDEKRFIVSSNFFSSSFILNEFLSFPIISSYVIFQFGCILCSKQNNVQHELPI